MAKVNIVECNKTYAKPSDNHTRGNLIVRVQKQNDIKEKKKEEGKFIDLPGAIMGKVVVRFPPEASGYLHIGHAKAALLNQYYQQSFNGKLVMRFDDTNPAKETEEFEKGILEDVKMLHIIPDAYSHSSDYFGLLVQFCELLLRSGHFYVDDTPAETMKKEREAKQPSKHRNNGIAQNLEMWEEMKKGTPFGLACCVRAKIDMTSNNGCMRDPTMYRCKNEPHIRTGALYKVYPTYDFACPIIDSIEGVTHALRTTEYHDRDDQYYWIYDTIANVCNDNNNNNVINPHGLKLTNRPYIWEYSRLNMMHTVLSKRKLTWLYAEKGAVEGWDDPRFPTIRGILRRGLTIEGLKTFIITQGSSKSVVTMDWDKIWSFNKKVIEPTAYRYVALSSNYDSNLVNVHIKGIAKETRKLPLHPKDNSLGHKNVFFSPHLVIEKADAEQIKKGDLVTFMNLGNVQIHDIKMDKSNYTSTIQTIEGTYLPDNKDFKNTIKINWIALERPYIAGVEDLSNYLVPIRAVAFDYLVTKAVLAKDDDFKEFLNTKTSWVETNLLGEPALRDVAKGQIIQLLRKGFYICDSPHLKYDPTISRFNTPLRLFSIPDGSVTAAPTTASNLVKPVKSESLLSKISSALTSSPLDVTALNQKIINQGDLVRKLKTEKADKAKLDEQIKALLTLKTQFKELSGKDWKPDAVLPKLDLNTKNSTNDLNSLALLHDKIVKQGDTVRKLKTEKADKVSVDKEVKTLLALKLDYKSISGQDWSPNVTDKINISTVSDKPLLNNEEPIKDDNKNGNNLEIVAQLNKQISDQGDLVRKLKADKSDKVKIQTNIDILLNLKSKFKSITNEDWKPSSPQNVVLQLKEIDSSDGGKRESAILDDQIKAQGDKIRQLKSQKAEKPVIDEQVTLLLNLKTKFQQLTGQEWKPVPGASTARPKIEKKSEKPKAKEDHQPANPNIKKVTRLGLEVTKAENFSEWYTQVITKAEMIEYYDVSGCYILRPWSYAIWEFIQQFFDRQIKAMGVSNVYFPIFVSRQALQTEEKHIADFSPEVAWVTRSGDTDLAEPIAIRPTSETVMYPAYSRWIKSHRDLPLKLNQWNNVVRWEFKHPTPFIRTREFLWQEGHSAFATYKEAETEVYTILDLYARIYEELLAIPVIKGRKTEKEKFAGGDYTTTVEAYIDATGRGIQGATSHHLGQNFSKIFDITFENPDFEVPTSNAPHTDTQSVNGLSNGISDMQDASSAKKCYVYQNSWGLTTRTIGVMVMIHGDDLGLVLPPRIAPVQVVIVPCGLTATLAEQTKAELLAHCEDLCAILNGADIRTKADTRDNYSPGWKFNHWELKGVPLRIELGPKEIKAKCLVLVRRDIVGDRETISTGANHDELIASIRTKLTQIHDNLYERAKNKLDANKVTLESWDKFCEHLDAKHVIQAPFCGEISCEDEIKQMSTSDDGTEVVGSTMGAKSLCIPFVQPKTAQLGSSSRCVNPKCKNKPKFFTLFGRSY